MAVPNFGLTGNDIEDEDYIEYNDDMAEVQPEPDYDDNDIDPDNDYNDDITQQEIPLEHEPTTEFDINSELGTTQVEQTEKPAYEDYDASLENYAGVFSNSPQELHGNMEELDNQNESNEKYQHRKYSEETGSEGSSMESLRDTSEVNLGNVNVESSKHAFNYDNDDDWDKLSDNEQPATPTKYISKMKFTDRNEAIKIAYIIIELLEEDVAKYLEENGIVPNSENYDMYGMLRPTRRKISGSSISINSNVSTPEFGQPSTMRLFYDREENELREVSIPNLPSKMAIDEIVEVNLHRSRKRFGKGPPIKYSDAETQTKIMALVTSEKAEKIFWGMYPKPDDWKPPLVPSRQASMDVAADKADATDMDVDKATIKPQIKRSIKKRILKPLPEDYYKDETFWTGSRFKGEYRNRQFHLGHFDFATGTIYESEFKNGHAHSRNHTGILVYPRGDTYEGQWRKGRYQAGEIVFADGLKYEPRDWNYCIPPDRRFKSEKILGVHAAGNTIYNDRFPPTEVQKLPPGCYDVGEGIYDPKTSTVTGYDGSYLRDITSYEHRWIVANCRKAKYPREVYVPKFSEDRLPGSSCEKRPCNK